jgi:serine/threonine protein kinase/WD40 repeat protein
MDPITPSVDEICLTALEKPTAQERSAYLDRACAGDDGLRLRVERLLRAESRVVDFLESPAPEIAATLVPTLTECTGTVIGSYKLLEQIGEGGFGIVYMADQQAPVRRRVALKIIKPGMDTRQVLARFKAELQALALMDHPNIARVLDAGATDSGRPYFVMELIRGVPITDYCDQNNLPVHERLDLFVQVCHAVQHAHQKGIIHRDIKPSNVLITLNDGRPVPKVIDFGVAKALNQQLTQETLFTRFSEIIGTPLYMSPEQAEMSSLDIDTRSDVYSLGVLLYELLTSSTPFDKERLRQAAYDEIRRIIREEEPPKPSRRISTLGATRTAVAAHRQVDAHRLSQLVHGDLDWIVMKALEKDRAHRYETANNFAADVTRYLSDQPIEARPPSAVYRFEKFARRHKMGLLSAALVTLALVAGAGISLWQAIRATAAAASERQAQQATQQALLNLGEEQQATRRELQHTQEAREKATRELFESLVAQARANRLSRRVGQRFGTFEILGKAIAVARELKLPAERFLEMRNEALAAMALADLRVAKEWTGTSESGMDFNPALQRYACGDFKGAVYVRRIGDGAEICRLPGPGPGETFPLFSPDGCLLAVAHPGLARLQVWRLPRNETSELAQTPRVLMAKEPAKILDEALHWNICFSPDSRQIAVRHPDLSIGVFDLATAKRVQHLASVGGTGTGVFNPAGRQLALIGQDGAQVRDLQTGKVLWKQSLSGYGEWLAWHPDGKTLAVGEAMTGGDVISLWDVGSGKQIAKLEGLQGGGLRFAFNHAGTLLASTGWSGNLCLWDPLANRQLFSTHVVGAFTPRFSPDDHLLATKEDGNKLRIREIAAAGEYRTLTANLVASKRPYGCSAISADGHLLAGGGGGSGPGVGLWDFSSGKLLAFLEGEGSHDFVLWEPSGALLTTGRNGLFRRTVHRDQTTGMVHLDAPEKLPVPGGHNMIAQSRDGRVLASAEFQGAVAWHADQPDQLIPLGSHPDARYVAVSPDGQWVVTGGFGHPGGAKVWVARTGKLEKDLPVVGPFCRVVFSPDGKRLLTSAGLTPQIRAWHVGSWAEVPFKEPPQGFVPAFSHDGKLLVVETGTGVARLLDPKTGREYARLEDPSQDRAEHFAFSPDGTQLVIATADGHCLHIWNLRVIRRRLAKMGLDWDLPPYPDLEAEAQVPELSGRLIVERGVMSGPERSPAGSDAFLTAPPP